MSNIQLQIKLKAQIIKDPFQIWFEIYLFEFVICLEIRN
jgi:hypothetical protein